MVLGGCGVVQVDIFEQCTIDAVLEPSAAFAGETIVATGDPFSQPYDTLITVGGERAEISAIDRSQCTRCDTCRAENGCGGCKSACADCVETVTFELPEVDPGPTTVRLYNAFGGTEAIPFTVLGGDTGAAHTADTGQSSDTSDTAADTRP